MLPVLNRKNHRMTLINRKIVATRNSLVVKIGQNLSKLENVLVVHPVTIVQQDQKKQKRI